MDGAMDGEVRNERMLLRIAALLVALALLAERAAGRSSPVRFLALSFLRRAETIARTFVAREMRAEWPNLEETPEFHCSPFDAAALALRFRLLAAVLVDLVDAACGSAGRRPFAGVAPDGLVPCTVLFLVFPSCLRPRPRDTS